MHLLSLFCREQWRHVRCLAEVIRAVYRVPGIAFSLDLIGLAIRVGRFPKFPRISFRPLFYAMRGTWRRLSMSDLNNYLSETRQ